MPTKDGSTKAKPKKKTTRRTPKKSLVIVESPSKAKTIEKYLGNRYKVMASLGHIRDLPKSKMGIDVENNYEPHYISIRGKGDVIKELRKEAKKSRARLSCSRSGPRRRSNCMAPFLFAGTGSKGQESRRIQ